MNNICIILVEPQGVLNIGAVCRSMMNFGMYDLRLVNPCKNYNGFTTRKIALKASNIIDKANIFSNLSEAIQDCHLIFGTTRRFSKYRLRGDILLPDQAAQKIKMMATNMVKVAYVFGREDFGLRNDELENCNFYVKIPTDKVYESINLSHAVNLCIYEISKVFSESCFDVNNNIETALASNKEIEYMLKRMKKTLLNIEFLNKSNPDHIIRTIKRILNRAKLDRREVKVFQGLWSRINLSYNKWKMIEIAYKAYKNNIKK